MQDIHLNNDMAWSLTVKNVYKCGYIVAVLSTQCEHGINYGRAD